MGSTTVCPIRNFPPPTELLVCYQPHRQKVLVGQKSMYETFLPTPFLTEPKIMLCNEASPDNCGVLTLIGAGVDPRGPTFFERLISQKCINLKKSIFLAKCLYCRCINDLLFPMKGHQ
jgi:hypothetical protein